jgi:hypothetical protein
MLKENTFLTGPDKADAGFVKGRHSVFYNIPIFFYPGVMGKTKRKIRAGLYYAW